MKEGRSSHTAEHVCEGRALAHGHTRVARYADPTARVLASDETRARIDGFFAEPRPRGLFARARRAYLQRLAATMVARTVAIDDVVREAAAPQLVVLGAGLDGRAWRMAELAGATVFEVDHPDTQREMRRRAAALTLAAKEVHFVPVDFTRDSLEAALAGAGHDATRPTTWVWEGVVMYLRPVEVEATLGKIAGRSAPGSVLALLYHAPSITVWMMSPFVGRAGEPFRSSFRPAAMRELLERHGFEGMRDESMREVGARLGGELAEELRPVPHLRLAVARRRA